MLEFVVEFDRLIYLILVFLLGIYLKILRYFEYEILKIFMNRELEWMKYILIRFFIIF